MIPYFVKYGHSTGGPLNKITELDGANFSLTSASKTVSLNELKRKHPEILYDEQMFDAVDKHYHEKCECGVKSKKTIEMIAKSVYDEQDRPEAVVLLKKKGDDKWDFETCLEWIKLLYGRNTLSGQKMESKAVKDLSALLWKCRLSIAPDELDKKYCVDIVVKNQSDEIIGGIQVKPITYYNRGFDHVTEANKKWNHPVYHLKYDRDENWINRLEVLSKFV